MTSKITQEIIESYNKQRYYKNFKHLCHAPFNNIYFNVHGQAAACWNTFWQSPKWPESSIHDIWFGPYFTKLRKNIKEFNLREQCAVCERNILSGNYMGTLAMAYDNPFELTDYPQVLELELSNQCNLECIMCRGELSSMIRKNRDNLPPLFSPYNDQFVEELVEFLPHLKEVRFNGGEPFLQSICYKIFDKIAEVNPEIEITVATNGTFLNNKVKETLEKCKFRINVSIDALNQENYESIRVNGDYKALMDNVKYFGDYCQRNNRIFSIMINPMRQNWWEMPDFVHWCNENNYHLWFNTVVDPEHCSLMKWDKGKLKEAYEELSKNQNFKVEFSSPQTHIHQSNIDKYDNLVENMIRVWAYS